MPVPKKAVKPKTLKTITLKKDAPEPTPVRRAPVKRTGLKRKGTSAGTTHTKTPTATKIEEAIKCYELQLAGNSLRAIGDQLGIAHTTVQNRIQLYLDTYVAPKVEDYRRVMFDRCERLLANLEDAIAVGDDKAINAYVRVLERQAKLLGTDMPTQVEATVKKAEPDSDVLARIEAARAKAQATQDAMIEAAEKQDDAA